MYVYIQLVIIETFHLMNLYCKQLASAVQNI